MKEMLQRNRVWVNRELACMEERQYFSPACYTTYRATLPMLMDHLCGKCIDAGCGDMPYRSSISGWVDRYDSIDLQQRGADLTFRGDIQDMHMICAGSYDSALCLEVLEHVPDPGRAVRELHRILKHGAKLVCSVPHLSRLHEEPQDYYRFTRYGLAHLLESAGFRIISLKATGGLASFLGHQLSSALLLPLWHRPVLKRAAFWINRRIIIPICYGFDRRLDRDWRFALGYVCVAQKE